MDQGERELLAARVLSGRLRIRIGDGVYWVRTPTPAERYEAAELAAEAERESSLRGVAGADDVLESLKEQGLWDDEKQAMMARLEKDVETLKVKLYECIFRSAERAAARRCLAAARAEFSRLAAIRHAWDHSTREGQGALVRARFLVSRTLLLADGVTPANDDDLVDDAAAAIERSRLSEAQARELARTEPWRSTWSCRHSEGSVFGLPARELSDEQRVLTVWSRIYDNAYESPECPPDDVVGDDDAFDGWLITRRRAREQQAAQKQVDDVLGDDRIRNSGEVFVLAETEADARRIDDYNDEEAARVKKQRLNFVAAKGSVLEAQMPDSAMKIRAEYMAKMAGK